MTFSDRFFRGYAHFYPGGSVTWAFVWVGLALASAEHWTTYVFFGLFLNHALSLVADRYYEQWCRDISDGHPAVPRVDMERLQKEPFFEQAQEGQGLHGAILIIANLQIHLGCIHKGWFDEARCFSPMTMDFLLEEEPKEAA